MIIRDEFEKWAINERCGVLDLSWGDDTQNYRYESTRIAIDVWQSQQQRIELLESAIREFNDADKAWCAARTDVGFKILDRYESAKSQLTYLMEQAK